VVKEVAPDISVVSTVFHNPFQIFNISSKIPLNHSLMNYLNPPKFNFIIYLIAHKTLVFLISNQRNIDIPIIILYTRHFGTIFLKNYLFSFTPLHKVITIILWIELATDYFSIYLFLILINNLFNQSLCIYLKKIYSNGRAIILIQIYSQTRLKFKDY
jgi:hypothetical protein